MKNYVMAVLFNKLSSIYAAAFSIWAKVFSFLGKQSTDKYFTCAFNISELTVSATGRLKRKLGWAMISQIRRKLMTIKRAMYRKNFLRLNFNLAHFKVCS